MLPVKAMINLTVLQIFLIESRSVLSPSQRVTRSKKVKVSVKNQKVFGFCWNYLKSDWLTSLGGFEWLYFFWFCLTLSVPEKFKNWIFEMPIIPPTLNINNLRTTSVMSTNLHTIRKLIKYSLKNIPAKAAFTLTVFEILLFEGRTVLSPVQGGAGSKRVNTGKLR